MAGAPQPEGGFTVYDSYTTDPQFARDFTYAAAGLVGLATLVSLPSAAKSVLNGRINESWGFGGLVEVWGRRRLMFTPGTQQSGTLAPPRRTPKGLLYVQSIVQKVLLRTPSLKLSKFHASSRVTVGALVVMLLVPLSLVATLLPQSQLTENPNRAGFLAVATLPWLFLLGGKSTGLSTLTGFSYAHLNFLHRWLGRSTLTLILIHMGLWATQWAQYGSSYMSDRFAGEKEQRGLLSLCFLLILALPSIGTVRNATKAGWRIFKVLHVVGFVGLIVGVNMHTTYAWPWTVGVIIVYAVDVAGRTSRYRFKDALVEPLEACGPEGENRMTRIRIQNVTDGWRAGQHIRLRLFFQAPPIKASTSRIRSIANTVLRLGRPLESHPFSISNAPSSISVVMPPHQEGTHSRGREVVLYVKANAEGTWTSDLYESASKVCSSKPKAAGSKTAAMHVTALIDGPYGGPPTYSALDANETVVLFAGGSGMSFVLGVLDELVGRAVRGAAGGKEGKGTRTRRVEVVWCVKDRDCVSWFAPTLDALFTAAHTSSTLSTTLSIHLPARASPGEFQTAKALSSITNSILVSTRCQVRPKLDELIEESINPCATCDDCRCNTGPEGCACGSGEDATEIPVLNRKITSDSDEIAEEDLPECCKPAAVSPASSGPGKTCCGKCGKGERKYGRSDEKWDVSEKTLRAGLDVRTGGLGVMVCGPQSMITDVRNAVASVPVSKAVKIGGIQLHSEVFGL